ncbi:hypothetical protein CHS0354_003900 [Potamilus streckersoni]|uniref:Failed axon connections n=1 Tax=Potamilus streckersoni TaxID=2493646 RepID=A0AAE0WBY4_9BIVA|nr:hypothetical protein CHS0354_003900 [Potamilus streckersoni]
MPGQSFTPAVEKDTKDTVILHQFERSVFAPSLSPFAMKLETYLRMTEIPYTNVFSRKFGPKGKIPWIELNGEVFADSSMIIEMLNQKFNKNVNTDLTPYQLAIARAMQKMVEENTYWTAILTRWLYFREESRRTLFPKNVPKLFMWWKGRNLRQMAHGQGMGRHSQAEVTQIMKNDLQALSNFLGTNAFFMGDKPTEVDCAIFGQLVQIKWNCPDFEGKKYLLEVCGNLSDYCDRMKEKFWPDWEECLAQKVPEKKEKSSIAAEKDNKAEEKTEDAANPEDLAKDETKDKVEETNDKVEESKPDTELKKADDDTLVENKVIEEKIDGVTDEKKEDDIKDADGDNGKKEVSAE